MLVTQLCPGLCDSMDCSPPGSSVHGILQVRILEWVAIPSSRGSSHSKDQNPVSCTAGRFFTVWAPREVHVISLLEENKNQWQTMDFSTDKIVITIVLVNQNWDSGGLGINTEHSPGNIIHFYGIPSVCFSRHSQMNNNNHEHLNCFHQQPVMCSITHSWFCQLADHE